MNAPLNIVGLGEVLWDVFPDAAHFGGAPANFACAAAGIGGADTKVWVVSAVGRDDLGEQALERLRTRGVDTTHVAQIDRPTGQVFVELDSQGHASYRFADNTAWDNTPCENGMLELASRCDAVCFGTLAQRSDVSRTTVKNFLQATKSGCRRILDINLRKPFWTPEVLLQSLELANVVKLNDEELVIVGQVFGLPTDEGIILNGLMKRFDLDVIALTRGADGALLASASGERSESAGRPATVVDTVGAGDAFTAVLTIGLLKNLPLATINDWANRVAAYVCSQAGAAPNIPAELRQP